LSIALTGMTYSYSQIIGKLRAFFEAHEFVERFTSGDFDASQIGKDYPYPHVHVQPVSVSTSGNQLGYQFQMMVMDLPRVEEAKQTYIENIHNQTLQILTDFISYIDKGDEFFDRNEFTFTNNAIEAFWDQQTQTVSGWTMTFTLSVFYDHDICNVPLTDAVPVPPAECAVATIKDSEGDTLFTVASGGEQVIQSYRLVTSSGSALLPVTFWGASGSSVGTTTLTKCISLVSDLGGDEAHAQDIADGLSGSLQSALKNLICSCADGTVNVNGELFDTVASGGTLNVPVQYENGTPVGTITEGVVEIPNPAGSTIIPCRTRPMKPGVSIQTGDLRWQYDNGQLDELDAQQIGRVRVLGADIFTLDANTPNKYGTTARYTFNDGTNAWNGSSFDTTYPAGADDYVIEDHITGLALYVANLGNVNWANGLSACQSLSVGTYQWRAGSPNELDNFIVDRSVQWYQSPNPFRRGVVSGYNSDFYQWTSRPNEINGTQAYQMRGAGNEQPENLTSTIIVSIYAIANFDASYTP